MSDTSGAISFMTGTCANQTPHTSHITTRIPHHMTAASNRALHTGREEIPGEQGKAISRPVWQRRPRLSDVVEQSIELRDIDGLLRCRGDLLRRDAVDVVPVGNVQYRHIDGDEWGWW